MRSEELEKVLFHIQRRLRALEGNTQECLARERLLDQRLRALSSDIEALRALLDRQRLQALAADVDALRAALEQRRIETQETEIERLSIKEELDRR